MKAKSDVPEDESTGTDFATKSEMKRAGFLTIREKELSAVRWSGAFLSSFGEYWNGLKHEKCEESLYFLEHVVFPVDGRNMNLSTLKWKAGGPYSSSLDLAYLGFTPAWLKYRKRELENLMSGFSATGDRQKHRTPEIVLVPALLYAQSIGQLTFDSIFAYHSKFTCPPGNNGWSLLLWQRRELNSDFEKGLMNLLALPPFPFRKLMVPLWDKCTNWRVLQASVHVDNYGYFDFGFAISAVDDSVLGGCWFEHIRKIYAGRPPHIIIEICMGRSPNYNDRYVGIVLESVRTFLSFWVSYQTPGSINPDWRPKISINQDIILGGDNSLDYNCLLLWRWEC